jgi:hypothetical protein
LTDERRQQEDDADQVTAHTAQQKRRNATKRESQQFELPTLGRRPAVQYAQRLFPDHLAVIEQKKSLTNVIYSME